MVMGYIGDFFGSKTRYIDYRSLYRVLESCGLVKLSLGNTPH